MLINEYLIEFSYRLANGNQKIEKETHIAYSSQEAVDYVRKCNDDLIDFRIEHVWIERNNRWESIEGWD